MFKFSDVFPEDLSEVPPPREVEFTIYLALSSEPISRPPYLMVPTELKELKAQLEEMVKAGFIRLSTSS